MKRTFLYALVVIVIAIGITSCEGGGGKVNNVKFRKMNIDGVSGENKGKACVYKAGDTTAGQVISVMVRLN